MPVDNSHISIGAASGDPWRLVGIPYCIRSAAYPIAFRAPAALRMGRLPAVGGPNARRQQPEYR